MDIVKIVKMMTSREVAELTGKEHAKVLRDIDNLLKTVSPELGEGFKLSHYKDATGKSNRMFEISGDSLALLLDRYKGLARVPNRLQEEAALKTIEQLLGVQLIRQFHVGGFRIDGYDVANNVAYEVDEPDHKHTWRHDIERQRKIESLLGCTFFRITL